MLTNWGSGSGNNDTAVGLWDWDTALREPLHLGLVEQDKQYLMNVRKPAGMQHDLKIELDGNLLTVRGDEGNEAKEERDGYQSYSKWSSSFQRSTRIPSNVDTSGISAQYLDDGTLQISLPKTNTGKKGLRDIPISSKSGSRMGSGSGSDTGAGMDTNAGSTRT